jgi:MEDS: MEthanogen/methylotroph, DcmR Sensory domain
MAGEDNTGTSVIDGAPCGTHGCLLYDTKQDLLDTLIPFFRSGLENREPCLWILSELLTKEEAWDALLHSVPDLDRHLFEQRIELVHEGAPTDSRLTGNARSVQAFGVVR